MRQVLTNFDVTGTISSGTIKIPRRRPWSMFLWLFEMPAGSGTNQLTITAQTISNTEADATTEELFDLVDASLWDGPRVITDVMVTQAPSSKLKLSSSCRAQWEVLRLNFVRAGGGSRTFRVNLWSTSE